MSPNTQEESPSGAITQMLEEKKKSSQTDTEYGSWEYVIIEEIIPQVRTMEETQKNKTKEEERQRIVGILDEIRNGYNQSFHPNLRIALQEAIERISNNQ